MPCRILLADDHAVVRQGFRSLLEVGGFDVVAEGADGQEAIQLAQTLNPDIAVLDLVMPVLDGVDSAREILQACPGIRVILLTMHTEEHHIARALRAGIRGYVVKTQAVEDLVHAVRAVIAGKIYLSPGVSQTFVQMYLPPSDRPSI